MLEELLGWDEVRQAGEELGHVDEVHAGQDVLVEAQQTQRSPKQELLAVPTEDVPHAARQVQWQGLAVEGEDPGREVEETHNELPEDGTGFLINIEVKNFSFVHKCQP